MSLKPSPIEPVPEGTARVARAAFRKGNPLLKLRDELGAVFADADFADLFPRLGQPGLPPWRLALVTLLQFRENLPDRQAAEAVRARIDWKYLLGLELADPGFDHSVLCEFRSRLLDGQRRGAAAAQAAGRLPSPGPAQGARPAAHRRHPRAGLHPRAQPPGAAGRDPARGAERAGHGRPRTGCAARSRRPGTSATPAGSRTVACRGPRPSARPTRAPSARTGSRCSTGSTGRRRPRSCGQLPAVGVLRQVWARHFVREDEPPPGGGRAAQGQGRPAARRRSRSSRPTTRRRASAPARAPPGPATSSTSPRPARTTRSTC